MSFGGIMHNRILLCTVLLLFGVPSLWAQFPFPRKVVDKIDAAAGKYKDLEISNEEEVKLGENISERIRQRFGVFQDPEIHRYVTMTGMVLARKSSRPSLTYQFIVLDTDGVNAFAAPGGFVHITKGALALMKNEADLAGVLGHELIHITERHAVRATQKNKALQMAAGQKSLAANPDLLRRVEDEMFKVVFAGFGRTDELESDDKGLALAAAAGYDAAGLRRFLEALEKRNSGSDSRQGLFASHPEMNERLQRIDASIQQANRKSGAMNQERLARYVKYQPVPLAGIAAVQDGASGLAEGSGGTDEKKKKESQEEPKKSRFSLSKLKDPLGGGTQKTQSAEVTASGGSRGVDREQTATGGPNPAAVIVRISEPDIQAFKKEGGLPD